MGQNGCRPGDQAVAVWDANPGAMGGEAPKPLAATSPGGRLEDRHIHCKKRLHVWCYIDKKDSV